jgi:hypothetical protein
MRDEKEGRRDRSRAQAQELYAGEAKSHVRRKLSKPILKFDHWECGTILFFDFKLLEWQSQGHVILLVFSLRLFLSLGACSCNAQYVEPSI